MPRLRAVAKPMTSDDDDEHGAGAVGERDRHDAGGDGPVALDRVQPVGLDVAGVVEQVGAAGGQAERDEGEEAVAEHRPLVDAAGGDRARRRRARSWPTGAAAGPGRSRARWPSGRAAGGARTRSHLGRHGQRAETMRQSGRGRWRSTTNIQRTIGRGPHGVAAPLEAPDDLGGDDLGRGRERLGVHARGHAGVHEAGSDDHDPGAGADRGRRPGPGRRRRGRPWSSRRRSWSCGPARRRPTTARRGCRGPGPAGGRPPPGPTTPRRRS